ncbi:hypothetical protein HPB48_016932 [Haemaphysalis longicornis]|uniref:Hexosyltransferase n=1 Tax=Haemaphysalis longicornis TaxID=44386 RepID=A0A9J6G370_HAELO|nr:hypothetical protein HPB48_016932 [Haemaphysalis longicornis]
MHGCAECAETCSLSYPLYILQLQVLATGCCFCCLAYVIVSPNMPAGSDALDGSAKSNSASAVQRRVGVHCRNCPGPEAVFCHNCSLPLPASIKRNDPEKSLPQPLFSYGYLSNVYEPCYVNGANSPPVRYLVAVNSLPENYASRMILRSNALPYRLYAAGARLIFFLGKPRKLRLRAMITMEIMNFGDIVVGDYDATPENATLTSLMILKWKTEFCPEAKFLVKVDDQGNVNYKFLRDYYDFFLRQSSDFEMFGSFVPLGGQPCQEPPLDSDVRNCTGIRGYLVGCAYLLTYDVVSPLLFAAAAEHAPTPPEDLYVTGTLGDSVNARKADLVNFEGCYVGYAKVAAVGEQGLFYWLMDNFLVGYAKVTSMVSSLLA